MRRREIFSALLLAATALPAAAKDCPAGSIRLAPGDDLAAAARKAKPGATFCILKGEHRLQAIQPKRGQTFVGEPGAVLNGSRLLKDFSRVGDLWVIGGQTQQGERLQTQECLPDRPRCSYPESVFIDGRPLIAVETKAKVRPGTFFFDYDADRIFIADDPAGAEVETSVSPYAFLGGAADVTVEGLTVEKYSTPIQHAAIGAAVASEGWTVRGNEMRLNHSVGVTVGTRGKIVGNLVRDNGEMGIGCVGADILIEGNEISGNGFFAGLDPAWEGGGGKCALTRRLVVRNNYSHDNNSYGFWTDIDNIDTLYEGNRIEDNASGGISHEISYRAVIRNNTFKGNGWAFDVWLWGGAIQIQNSQDVEVYGNEIEIDRNGNGICLIQQKRGKGRYGPYVTVRNAVHDNRITSLFRDRGASGTIADHDPEGLRRGKNRFDRNTYRGMSGADDHWAWVDGFYGWDDYRRVSGQDAHSLLKGR